MNTVFPDLQISWFLNEKELRESDIFKMSHYGETCRLEITRVLRNHEGEFSCLATNSAGMVTCAATLSIDGELFGCISVDDVQMTLSLHVLHQKGSDFQLKTWI